jgi:hypothetical protein
MPCDLAFAQIQKIKQRKDYVFVPEEWYDLEFLILEDGTDTLPRNVGKGLLFDAA